MNPDLKGKVVLVTGSSRGIGLEIARAFGLAGARVALSARDVVSLKFASERLLKEGIECTTLVSDLTKKGTENRLVTHVQEKWGTLDILVNNVGGIVQTGTFFDLTDDDWQASFDLNFMSVVRMSRAAIPLLRRSAQPRIINISSVTAKQPGSMNPHYSACKLAVTHLTKHLANLVAAEGILVNSVSPGIIQTDGWDDYLRNKATTENRALEDVTREEGQRAGASSPLGRMGTASEVAALVLLLGSSAGSYMTGADYLVDGGKTRGV